jgi:hypothetical protein
MRLIICILSVLLFFGCTQKIESVVEPPEDLIPQDQMVDIVTDLFILEAILIDKQRKKSDDFNFSKYYIHNSILEKYNITRKSFEDSFNYYAHDLKTMDDIYADAITKLSKMQGEVKTD